jgi:anti-sigma factor RsiW
MTCADLEILLCDYMDGTLPAGQKTALQGHLAACSSCAQFAKDVAGTMAFIETVPAAEPPRELVTRILQRIPTRGQRDGERESWWQRLWDGWVLQPRFAMGMAMTVLSISMFASLGRLETKQLSAAALDPARVWQSLDDSTYRVWDRTVKYYDNNPLVMDIQSRWQDWNQPEQTGPNEREPAR